MSEGPARGAWRRTGILGAATARIGANKVRRRGGRLLGGGAAGPDERAAQDETDARILFDAFTQLRGTALKISQLLSMELELFPEAWQKELARSYNQVPPLNRAVVRKVFLNEMQRPPEDVFAAFEAEAFAAASLGQVHGAVLRDGRAVAVKIQYPGIAESIDDDLKLVRRVVRMMPQRDFLLPALAEIEDRLREEVDYELEGRRMNWFADHLDVADVAVPRALTGMSTRRILVMERAEGRHLAGWLEGEPGQDERDHFAQLLYDIFMSGLFTLGRMHADPNPGNYLMQPGGKLALLDFGCVKDLDPAFCRIFRALMRAYLAEDEEEVLANYVRLGMFDDPDRKEVRDFYREVLAPFGAWVSRPVREESFDFAANPDYMRDGRRFTQDFLRQNTMHALCQDFVFTDRTFYGLVRLFNCLGATVRMRHHWLEES